MYDDGTDQLSDCIAQGERGRDHTGRGSRHSAGGNDLQNTGTVIVSAKIRNQIG